MGKFAARVEVAVQALGGAPPGQAPPVDENDFIDASRLVYDAVREIRKAVLMNRVSTPQAAFGSVQQMDFYLIF